nr:unnamed protein product [Callosobruchus chinensis]
MSRSWHGFFLITDALAMSCPSGATATSQQQFVLRWHYHEPTLLHGLSYFLDQDVLTDVTISVGAHQLRAHKVILAMCSVYFLQMFQELKSTHPVVVLHNVSFDEVKAILSFMYRGQCVVSQEQLPSLLSVAKLLKVQGLCDMKVPDKQVQTTLAPEKEESVHERGTDGDTLTNEQTCDTYETAFHKNCISRQEQIESINLKRQTSEDMHAVQDLSTDNKTTAFNRRESLPQQIDDKTAPVMSDTPTPLKFDEDCCLPFPMYPTMAPGRRQLPLAVPRESSETCKCFLCGKYLSNQYNLRVHMETHEEAYHACQSCPHVSRSRDALRKHVSYRHPEEYHNRKRKKTSDS